MKTIRLSEKEKNKKIRRFFNGVYLLRLIIKNYFSNIFLIVFNLIFPIVIFLFLKLFFAAGAGSRHFLLDLLVGVAASSTMSVGLLSFSYIFVEWRGSVLYKKIRVHLSSTTKFLAILSGFFIAIGFIFFWLIIGIFFAIIQKTGEKEIVVGIQKMTSWGWFVAGTIQLSVLSVLLGGFVSFFVKNTTGVIAICFTIFLIICFTLGAYTSIIFTMGNSKTGVFNKVILVIPLYAPIRLIQCTMFENLIWGDVDFPAAAAIKTENIMGSDFSYNNPFGGTASVQSFNILKSHLYTFLVGCSWVLGIGGLFAIQKALYKE